MINGVDLFCGLGGLTHGLVRAGVAIRAGIDVDGDCRFPYEQNNPSKFIHRDICELTGDDLKKLWCGRGKKKLLAGCAPCQPFSTYSRKGRSARKDTKWELVLEFGRLIEESRPHLVTMENVPQLMDHAVFEEFEQYLEEYHIWYDVVECSSYGVPQTRKRLVLLASRLGPIELIKPTRTKKGPTVEEAIGNLSHIAAGEHDPSDHLHWACNLSDLNLRRIRASKPGGTWRDWPKSLRSKCHRRSTGETYPSVYGRMEWSKPSPTITTQCFGYGNGRFGHPEQDRAITLREAAILQTFPRDYKFLREGDKPCFHVLGKLIGNAVPVRIGEIVAKSLIANVKSHG